MVSTSFLVVSCLLLAFGLSVLYTSMSDPYGLFHLKLNQLPQDDPKMDPRTEWLNMGYWKNTDVFPEACEALAMKLLSAARYGRGENVLDVGHGTGESLILLLTNPDIPRPACLTGITSLPLHYQRSRRRIERLQSKTQVDLFSGDAVYRSPVKGHPLDIAAASPPFTIILALDCAYHFDTRDAFLRQSFARLAPGGKIALADIVFDAEALTRPSLMRRWLMPTFLMPKRNIISKEKYVQDMLDMGYVDVELEDVSEDVFPGFMKFLRSRGLGWSSFSWIVGICHKAGARFVVVAGSKPTEPTF